MDTILWAVQYLDPLSAQLLQPSFTHLIAGLTILVDFPLKTIQELSIVNRRGKWGIVERKFVMM
jgi:hypothetical protein